MMMSEKKPKSKAKDINTILTNGARAIKKRKARPQSSSRSLANRFSESNYFKNSVLNKQDVAALIMGKKGKLKSSNLTPEHLKNLNWQHDSQSEQEATAEDEDSSMLLSFSSSRAFSKRRRIRDNVLSCEQAVERVKNSKLYFKYIPMIKEQYEQRLNTDIKDQYLTRFEKLRNCPSTLSQTDDEKSDLCKLFLRHKELNTSLWEYASIPPEFNFENIDNDAEDFRLKLSDLKTLHDTDKEYYSEQLIACSTPLIPSLLEDSSPKQEHTEIKVEEIIEKNQHYNSSDSEFDMTGIFEIEDSDDGISEPLFPHLSTQYAESLVSEDVLINTSTTFSTMFFEKSNSPVKVYNDMDDDIIVTSVMESKNSKLQTPPRDNNITSNISKTNTMKDFSAEDIIEIVEIPGTPSPQYDRLSLGLISKDPLSSSSTDTSLSLQQVNNDKLFYQRQKQDFSKLSLKELKKQMDDWGFKPCKSRAENIEILNSCNVYLPLKKPAASLEQDKQSTTIGLSDNINILGEITNTHTSTSTNKPKKIPRTARQIEALSTGELKNMIDLFGFRPVRSRSEMIERLKECCLKDTGNMPKGSLNSIKRSSIRSGASTPDSIISSPKINSSVSTLVESIDSAGTTQVENDNPSEVVETEDLDGKISRRISEALKTQEYFNDIWVKILTYQPLDLEEFCKFLNTKLTMYLSTKFVREWCDKHGITTTTANNK